MGLVVTGISQDGDIAALEQKLKDAAMPLDRIQVIGPNDSDTGAVRRLTGPRIMTSGGGTGLPGINGPGNGFETFRHESKSDRLGDLEIPESEIENYVEALDAGRTVIGYFAHADTLAAVEAIFRESGLAKVKTF